MNAPPTLARASQPARADVERLYEASRLLARFESVEATVPAVLALVSGALDLRTTFVIVETAGRARSLGWRTARRGAGTRAPRMHAARTRARAAFAYYSGAADLELVQRRKRARFVSLPLAIAGRPAFGVVQLEASGPLDEAALGFACEVVRELAVALQRHARAEGVARTLRARRDVLAVVAHDLRSPLQAIHLTTQLMLAASRTDSLRAAEEPQLALIGRCVRRMARMLDDIHDTTNVEVGRLAVNLERCVLGGVLAEAFETLGPLGAAKGVRVEVIAERDDARVLCDRGRVVQILTNLVGNAVKFSDAGEEVRVSVRLEAETLRFEVSDRGKGIAPHELPHLFEAYWQGESGAHAGLGLGLYISKELVEAQGGTIGVEARVGRGSTFFFTLPRAP